MLAQCVFFGFHIGEVSCPTKYFAEASSINFRRSVQYGLGVLLTSYSSACRKSGWHSSEFSTANAAAWNRVSTQEHSPKATDITITDGRSGG